MFIQDFFFPPCREERLKRKGLLKNKQAHSGEYTLKRNVVAWKPQAHSVWELQEPQYIPHCEPAYNSFFFNDYKYKQ